MAFITAQEVKEIRNQLKKAFPEIKFSVTKRRGGTLNVSIMESPYDFGQSQQLNHYYLDRYPNADILKRIKAIANQNNYNNSDPMIDYFDVGYWFELDLGKWDKSYVVNTPAKEEVLTNG